MPWWGDSTYGHGRRPLAFVRGFVVPVTLAATLGCSPAAPTPGERGVELTGTVVDTVGDRVIGAQVTLTSPTGTVIATTSTDAGGQFQIPVTAPVDSRLGLAVSRERFQTLSTVIVVPTTGRLSARFWTLQPAEPLVMVGRYRVTLTPAASCPAFPQAFSPREYDATWADNSSTEGSIELGGRFTGHMRVRTAVDRAYFWANRWVTIVDDDVIFESIGERGHFAIGGQSGKVPVERGQTVIETAFSGSLEYCAESAMTGDGFVHCSSGRIACSSPDHRLRLVRR